MKTILVCYNDPETKQLVMKEAELPENAHNVHLRVIGEEGRPVIISGSLDVPIKEAIHGLN